MLPDGIYRVFSEEESMVGNDHTDSDHPSGVIFIHDVPGIFVLLMAKIYIDSTVLRRINDPVSYCSSGR